MNVLSPGTGAAASCTAVTIGTYDGVHLGHQSLFRELLHLGRSQSLTTTVVTFDPHPSRVVNGASGPLSLTSLAHKLDLIGSLGIDQTMVVPFDQSRAHESAEDFVRNVLARDLSARLVVVGTDFHFGRGRAGNVEVLTRLGRTHGFRVVAAPLRLSEGDPISSSRIRRLIAQGNMETAALLLGRPHCVTGTRLKGASMEDSGASFSVVVPADIAVPAAGLYFGDFGHEHGSRQDALLHVVDDTGLERLIDLRPLNTETGGDNSLDSSLTLSLSFALKLPRMKSGSLITRELANQFESADVLRNTSARRQ